MRDKDLIVMQTNDGREWKVPWGTDLTPYPLMDRILTPRMPETAAERFWFWTDLPGRLAPGGSMRFVGPSLHA